MPFDGSRKGTLFHALEEFNSKRGGYYINTHRVVKLADDTAYDANVERIQDEGMHGIAEVAVEDLECEAGVRTNHVMAVVNGGLVDPSDGSFHAWPDRHASADHRSWLRDVTMFLPMTKLVRVGKKQRPSSKIRNANKRAKSDHAAKFATGSPTAPE